MKNRWKNRDSLKHYRRRRILSISCLNLSKNKRLIILLLLVKSSLVNPRKTRRKRTKRAKRRISPALKRYRECRNNS